MCRHMKVVLAQSRGISIFTSLLLYYYIYYPPLAEHHLGSIWFQLSSNVSRVSSTTLLEYIMTASSLQSEASSSSSDESTIPDDNSTDSKTHTLRLVHIVSALDSVQFWILVAFWLSIFVISLLEV